MLVKDGQLRQHGPQGTFLQALYTKASSLSELDQYAVSVSYSLYSLLFVPYNY